MLILNDVLDNLLIQIQAQHMKELMKLKNFHEKTTQNFLDLMQKRYTLQLYFVVELQCSK